MPEKAHDRWSEMRARALADPAARDRYERTYQYVRTIRRVLQAIDAERERAGLTKAELARQIDANPATIRRLFTSSTSNPTLKTVVELADALGLEVSVQARAGSADDRAEHTIGSAVGPDAAIAKAGS